MNIKGPELIFDGRCKILNEFYFDMVMKEVFSQRYPVTFIESKLIHPQNICLCFFFKRKKNHQSFNFKTSQTLSSVICNLKISENPLWYTHSCGAEKYHLGARKPCSKNNNAVELCRVSRIAAKTLYISQ